MNELESKVEIKLGSNRNFGVVFSLVFFLIGFWPLFSKDNLNFFFIFLGFLFIVITLCLPSLLKIPNFLWFKFGILLGNIISPIIMLLIYILTFVPTKIYFIITNKDPMKIKYDKEVDTYWVDRKKKLEPMDKQY